jgi:DNA-binding NarL/FixJ family response regulator
MTVDPRSCGPLLVVDDDEGVRVLVSALVEQAGYVPRPAATGEEALAALDSERPAGAIIDVQLPGISGYEVCRELRDRFGETLPIVFISGERVEALDRVAGLLLGADDYLVKPFAPDELLARLRRLVRRPSASRGAASKLTGRELEVLRLLAAGLAQAEIAEQLVISPKTVATHIEHILSKLGVRSRAQAVALAYRDDLVGAMT